MRTAALFPGQGSHVEHLTETLARHRPDLLELADAELGENALDRAAESTAYAQPATYCASLAGWSLLGPERVDVLVGHSLGELSALAAAGAVDEAAGLRLVALRGRLMERAPRKPIPGAFHSFAMTSAREEFADALRRIPVGEPRIPVFSCLSAAPMDDPRCGLTQGLTSPVRWRETLVALRARGVKRFIEVGPGSVLTWLVKRTLDGVEATTAKL
jgi:malonyl CoA-acyl carrier protein transacylase